MATARLGRGWRDGQNGGAPGVGKICTIAERTQTHPTIVDVPGTGTDTDPDRPWQVIVWNDPINLMSYVTYVFQKLFGYSLEKAEALMLDVHHKGRAVVSSGTRERAELDVFRLHECSLWATMEQA
jgi:ATP-dependent Clp protease adaptor protein ClpS